MTHEALHQAAMTCLFYAGYDVVRENLFDIYAERGDEDIILTVTDNHIYISHRQDNVDCVMLEEMLKDCLG